MASRRLTKSIIALAATLALSVPVRADEGMWLLPLLDRMNGDMICKLGGHLTPGLSSRS